MNSKKVIMIGATVGLFLGGLVPELWGASAFSSSSIIFSTIGGFVGIWIAFKLNR